MYYGFKSMNLDDDTNYDYENNNNDDRNDYHSIVETEELKRE